MRRTGYWECASSTSFCRSPRYEKDWVLELCIFYHFLWKSYVGEGLGTGTVHLLPVSVELLGRRRTGYWNCASSTSFCGSPRQGIFFFGSLLGTQFFGQKLTFKFFHHF